MYVVIKIICLLVMMYGLIFYMSLMIKIGRICQNIILCVNEWMFHFLILARGLPRHWNNVLNGDDKWLEAYKQYKLAGVPKKVIGHLKDSLSLNI